MEKDKINEVILKLIKTDYKFGYSFDYNYKYEHIINYWNFWFLKEENNDMVEILDNLNFSLDNKTNKELEIIFRAHYNSSGYDFILFISFRRYTN